MGQPAWPSGRGWTSRCKGGGQGQSGVSTGTDSWHGRGCAYMEVQMQQQYGAAGYFEHSKTDVPRKRKAE